MVRKQGEWRFCLYHCCYEISQELGMSGRVPCTQASVVWDLVAFLRRCETRVLGKPRMFKWPRGCKDRLLSRAGRCGRLDNSFGWPPTSFQRICSRSH